MPPGLGCCLDPHPAAAHPAVPRSFPCLKGRGTVHALAGSPTDSVGQAVLCSWVTLGLSLPFSRPQLPCWKLFDFWDICSQLVVRIFRDLRCWAVSSRKSREGPGVLPGEAGAAGSAPILGPTLGHLGHTRVRAHFPALWHQLYEPRRPRDKVSTSQGYCEGDHCAVRGPLPRWSLPSPAF